MYDRNGLELSPIQDSLNAYKFTAVNPKIRAYSAYAQATRGKGIYSMVTIARFDDARDAAFVGQEFAKAFTIDQVYQMVIDKTFDDVAKDFVANLDMPVWQYPAEGLDWDDITGENGYTKNRVDNAREALVEALKVCGKPSPALAVAKKMIAQVEALYKNGMSFREAAKNVVNRS
jgi:hypothetical protein